MTQYIWRVKTRLPERYKTLYKVIARGKMNSCLVEFEDGYRVVTSRNYLMKFETICTAVNDTNRTKKDTKDTSEDLTPYQSDIPAKEGLIELSSRDEVKGNAVIAHDA